MSYSILAEPGTELGPCTKPCEHADCDRARQIAASICPSCRNPIGFERAFSYPPEDSDLEPGPWHLLCLTYQLRSVGAGDLEFGFS